jgi:hypothetical protein
MSKQFNPLLPFGFDEVGGGTGGGAAPLGTPSNPFPSTGRYFYDVTGALWVETLTAAGILMTATVAVTTTTYYASLWGLLANVE